MAISATQVRGYVVISTSYSYRMYGVCVLILTCIITLDWQGMVMQQHGLGLDQDDVRLIRCNNCLQFLACMASCLNICIDFDGDDA